MCRPSAISTSHPISFQRALGLAALLLAAAALSFGPAPVQACEGTPKPPICAVSGVMIKTSPRTIASPPVPSTINIPVTVIVACSPDLCATLGIATVTINLVPFGGGPVVATGTTTFVPPPCRAGSASTMINVPVPIPAGLTGLFTVQGTATIPTTAPNLPPGSVTTIAGDTVVSLVEEAPGQPGVPRLDVKLISPTPANPFIIAGPGSQVAAIYRVTNNDPSESVTVTLTGTSKQGARLPTGNPAVYSIATPFTGDDFPIAYDGSGCSIQLPDDMMHFNQPPITQALTLAPGATKDIKVSSRSHPMCSSGSCSEQALLATGSFAGGDPVEACASVGHIVQVGLPNTCCGVADSTCPKCNVAGPFSNPQGESFIQVSMQDPGSGLGHIIATQQSSNMSLSDPGAYFGTTGQVVITGTKKGDQTKKASVQFTVVDVCGNKVICDPVVTDVLRPKGKPEIQTHTNLPAAEDTVTIHNGTPGLVKLDVVVNGRTFKVNGLADGEERTLDISAALLPGDVNTVTFQATGKPGGSATVMIWEGNP